MKKEEDTGSTKKGSPHNPHEEKQRGCWDGGKGNSQGDGSAAGLVKTGRTAQESVSQGTKKEGGNEREREVRNKTKPIPIGFKRIERRSAFH